jgi:hypothetical protein
MEGKYDYKSMASVEVSIRDLEKVVAVAKYFDMSSREALHYIIRKGIECVWEAAEVPEVEVREPKIFDKKIDPEYYDAVAKKEKTFEIREDEDEQAGDTLILREWEGNDFTSRFAIGEIKYVLRNCEKYGLKKGYCVIGFDLRCVGGFKK